MIAAKTDGKTVTVNNDGALTVSDDVMNNLTNFEVTTGEHVDQFVANTAANSKKTRVKPGDVVTYASGKILLLNKKVQPLRFLPQKMQPLPMQCG